MQPRHAFALTALCGLASLGCAHSPATVPSGASADAFTPAAGTLVSQPGDLFEFAAGGWTIAVDPVALTGSVTGIAPKRSGQFNGDLFGLAVDQFFGGSALKISGVSIDLDGHLVLDLAIAHPFSGPSNIDGPATAGNRADLGITGRFIMRAPVPSSLVTDETQPNHAGDYQFQSPEGLVTANPKLLRNADGFFNSGDCGPGGTALYGDPDTTLHPYVMLVDESNPDCRTSTATGAPISNPNGTGGNFSGINGYTYATITNPGSTDARTILWTGYGMLHQGQTSNLQLVLDIDELSLVSSGTFTFDTQMFAKYVDPRTGSNGAELRSNRLPTNDPADFAYRLPYAALDVARCVQIGTCIVPTGVGQVGTATIAIVDENSSGVVDPNFPSSNLRGIPADSSLGPFLLDCPDLGISGLAGTLDSGTGTVEDPFLVSFDLTSATTSDGGVDALNHAWVTVTDRGSMPGSDTTIFLGEDLLPLSGTDKAPSHKHRGHVTILK